MEPAKWLVLHCKTPQPEYNMGEKYIRPFFYVRMASGEVHLYYPPI